MSASKRWVSAEVEQLLDLFLAAATEINRPYAIGGALVMGVHGYRRHTDDVDAYVNHVDRVEWVRALRKQGLTVTPLFSGGRILDGDDQDTLGHLRRLRAKLTDDERGEARRSIG